MQVNVTQYKITTIITIIKTTAVTKSLLLHSLYPEAQPEWGRRGHGPPKKLVKIFRWCFISISTIRKQTEGTVGLCNVVFSHWPRFNVTFCDWMRNCRTKACNLLAKLPINANNTCGGVAWMKCKGAVFLQRSANSDETFLRGLFAWSIAEPNRNILGQDMISPKRPTQWSVMQQRNASHSTVSIVASGYAKPGRKVSILKWTLESRSKAQKTRTRV